ncbi:trehalose-phosphatase [Microbacterium gilvum]|uniref:Trehalose 6-phosphate phosphatase n=1 Tax=Microbacterium gilvum TaxID=1336204 RepID=A0ABP8ZQI8_9MICO
MTAHAIAEVARTRRLLVALDFDGTLAPLVDEPMTARALPEARTAVARLAALPDTVVAFVSGRSLADLRVIAEHDDASPVWLSGSHGAEHWRPGSEGASSLDAPAGAADLIADAEAAVADVAGAWIERKSFGFGLHTRLADDAAASAAARAVDALVAERAPGWRRRTGRDVVEFAWRHEGKDTAIAALRAETGATGVVFAGDDVTDEDALRSLGEGDLGVRVGDGETAAQVRVADPGALALLLDEIADAREAEVDAREA